MKLMTMMLKLEINFFIDVVKIVYYMINQFLRILNVLLRIVGDIIKICFLFSEPYWTLDTLKCNLNL